MTLSVRLVKTLNVLTGEWEWSRAAFLGRALNEKKMFSFLMMASVTCEEFSV